MTRTAKRQQIWEEKPVLKAGSLLLDKPFDTDLGINDEENAKAI